MSRFPRGIDAAYLQHEHERRVERVLAMDVRYDCVRRNLGREREAGGAVSQEMANLIASSIRESARAVLLQKGIAPDVAEMLSKEIGRNAACGVVFAIEEQES